MVPVCFGFYYRFHLLEKYLEALGSVFLFVVSQ